MGQILAMQRTVTTMPEAFDGLMFSFVVLILLVMRDVQMELKEIRRELKQKDGETQSRIEMVLSGKTPEEQYDILYWLMMEYGKGHSNSRLARIEWLKDGEQHD